MCDVDDCSVLAQQLHMPVTLIRDVRRVFDLYCTSDDRRDNKDDDTRCAQAHIGAQGVRAALAALGAGNVSTLDATALTRRLCGTSAELHTARAGVVAHDDVALSFSLFVQLLQQRLGNIVALCDDDVATMTTADAVTATRAAHGSGSEDDVDVRAAMRLLDVDGDGVLSERDVRQYVQQYTHTDGNDDDDDTAPLTSVHPDVVRVAAMHAAELRAALQECDMDGDGVVTLSDVYDVLAS